MTKSQHHLDHPLDFGPDGAEAALPADPAFDAWIANAAPSLNRPGSTPADAMWQAIQRSTPRAPASVVTPLRRARWVMPATIAATLLLGVALDRMMLRRSAATPATSTPVALRPATTDSGLRADLYRVAALQTLGQAEAVLTAYRASGTANRSAPAVRQLGGWARDVLGSTRLLIDSPAGADAQLRPLLNDIELVLVQIVRLSGTPLDSTDRALIDRALREHDLLPRLRTAVPAGTTDASRASDN